MKYFLTIMITVFLGTSLFAQEKTTEVKTTINQTTGDTVYTQATIISETEDITPRNYMLSVNPLKFLLLYNITFYTKVSPNLVIGGGIQTPTIKGVDGFGVNAEMRFYPTGKNMRGFYIAPNIAYNKMKKNGYEADPFSVGVLLGWQWFPSDQFAMGLGIGTDYYSGTTSGSTHDEFSSYDGWVPALRFDIGFAW